MKITDLHKSFGRKEVLCGINLQMEEGIYGLLGPNGAGKTTLLRCITGLYKYKQGDIQMPEGHIGYLPQHFGTYKELKTGEALELFAVLKNIPKEKCEEEILRALEKVNLTEQKDKKVKQLSGGMKRRLGIAQTLLGKPPVLIYDEPTAGLDPEERLRFKRLISEMQQEQTVIISTHIVEDVEAVCDRIIVMNEGKILYAGTGEKLASLAEGKVFQCSEEELNSQTGSWFIEKTFEKEGKRQCRILSSESLPFQKLTPETEDGYLCVLKNI